MQRNRWKHHARTRAVGETAIRDRLGTIHAYADAAEDTLDDQMELLRLDGQRGPFEAAVSLDPDRSRAVHQHVGDVVVAPDLVDHAQPTDLRLDPRRDLFRVDVIEQGRLAGDHCLDQRPRLVGAIEQIEVPAADTFLDIRRAHATRRSDRLA